MRQMALKRSAAKSVEHNDARPAKRGAPKPVNEENGPEVLQTFNDMQGLFETVFEECDQLWQESYWSSDPVAVGPRKSWRSAWGHLQTLLKAAFHDIVDGKTRGLSWAQRGKCSDAARLLYQKLQVSASAMPSSAHALASVLQNQNKEFQGHLHALTRAIANVVIWSQLLQQLVERDFGPRFWSEEDTRR